MAQTKVNGAAFSDQFLTGGLTYFIVDEVDGAADISSFGYTAGVANPGEEILTLISDVVNPVIVESVSSQVMHIAVEVDGISGTDIANVINGSSTFANATVTAGSFRVV